MLKKLLIAAAIIVIGLGGYFLFAITTASQNGQAPEVKGRTEEIADTSQVPTPPDSTTIETKLYEAIRPYPGLKVGVSVNSLDNNNTADISKGFPFIAASTTKVLIATYTYSQAEAGKINLDSTLLGSGLSYRANIRKMIVVSDNDAWKNLMEHFGYSNYQSYVNNLGYSSFKTDGNIISANDMSGFLKQLHNGELIKDDNLDELLSFMSQSLTGPLALNEQYKEYPKKTGWLEDRLHFVGITTAEQNQKSFAIYIETTDGGFIDYEYTTELVNDLLEVISNEEV